MAISAHEARAIAKDAYIYGFPLVENYRIMYSYFVDPDDPEYKTPWNQIWHNGRLFGPLDKTLRTPNADTLYSNLGADLWAEPLVLTIPAVEKTRYYSVQFIDLFTFSFAYAGSRSTGNEGGRFLLAGPRWTSRKIPEITSVFRAETDLAFVLYRTQLRGAKDMGEARAVQGGYKVQTLSRYLGTAPPPRPPTQAHLKPLDPAQERVSLEFFRVLNFVLLHCAAHPTEKALFDRFGSLAIGATRNFDQRAFPPEILEAVAQGMADAWAACDELRATKVEPGLISSADLFGTRESLAGNYLYRMLGAVDGIYGNVKEEAIYPSYWADSDGLTLDGARHDYALRFPPNGLPPANAFWSLTLYELPSRLLCANGRNRYAIGSSMLDRLTRDPDGGLTIFVQHEAVSDDRDTNWLPAPSGPFFLTLRLYWPKPEALDGRWSKPLLRRVR